ncbi:hypothetical protein FKM82_014618 [Ascaphus truei]
MCFKVPLGLPVYYHYTLQLLLFIQIYFPFMVLILPEGPSNSISDSMDSVHLDRELNFLSTFCCPTFHKTFPTIPKSVSYNEPFTFSNSSLISCGVALLEEQKT